MKNKHDTSKRKRINELIDNKKIREKNWKKNRVKESIKMYL